MAVTGRQAREDRPGGQEEERAGGEGAGRQGSGREGQAEKGRQ